METLSATNVDHGELARLDAVVAELPSGSPLGAALQYVSASVRRGESVTLANDEELLTPARAARLLGMSRTHLYKLLDADVLPSRRVGRDRRIAMADLVEFESLRHAQRAELAERFAHATASRALLVDQLAREEA